MDLRRVTQARTSGSEGSSLGGGQATFSMEHLHNVIISAAAMTIQQSISISGSHGKGHQGEQST